MVQATLCKKERPYLQNNHSKKKWKDGGMAKAVDHLHNKVKDLISNSSTAKKERKEREKKEKGKKEDLEAKND
jgi:hypothetical protein